MLQPPKYNEIVEPSAPQMKKSQKIFELISQYEIDNLFSEK